MGDESGWGWKVLGVIGQPFRLVLFVVNWLSGDGWHD